MARRTGIYGPYQHGNKWRVVTVTPGGQSVESCETKEKADKLKEELLGMREAEEGITVATALERYEVSLRIKGNKRESIYTTTRRIKKFFGELTVKKVAAISSAACATRYKEIVPTVSADMHFHCLHDARTFFKWCIAQGFIKRNPTDGIKPTGKRKKGKPQLRIDEARKWLAVGIPLAWQHIHVGAGPAAAVATMFFGTRATETAQRKVRDLDNDGRLFWIEDTKTEAGKRTLEVPEEMRPLLLELAKGKKPTDRLFHATCRAGIWKWVGRICKEAGVPHVSPHGMRGLHSTLAVQAGATPHLVAGSLGHTKYAMTEEHYIDRGIAGTTKQRAALKVLSGGK